MGRRHSGAVPAMRRDDRTGHARVRIDGKTYWLGRFGSPEAQLKYDGIVAAYLASGSAAGDRGRGPSRPARRRVVSAMARRHQAGP
jgi:hypothetical protein